MRGKVALLLALLAPACNLLLGLEPPATDPAAIDAPDPTDDGAVADASPADDASPIDDAAIDALVPPPPVDAPTLPVDAPIGPCVPIDDFNECTFDVCMNGQPVHPPVPRDTLCNGWQDQCDGDGHCVDCTTSGGCGECCTCSVDEMCIPA
jgi:hypothetical protein